MELKYSKEIITQSPLNTLLGFDCFKDVPNLTFQYSIYENGVPGSGTTKFRKVSDFSDMHFFYEGLEKSFDNLPVNTELAIHSKVSCNSEEAVFHIPFIDFITPNSDNLFDVLSELQKEFNYDIYIFKSGRSFHAYLDALITPEDWGLFLAELLLVNKNNETIDVRWVAHSMKQKFSSLRLSCNTIRYIQYPIFFQKIPKSEIR